jgi:hypothetical protein
MADCEHDWEEIDFEEGSYRSDVCLHCNSYRWVDLVTGRETITEELEDGQVIRDDNLYCGACGMLAAPGSEEYDWCDHRTGRGCSYMVEDDEEDDFSDYEDQLDSLEEA